MRGTRLETGVGLIGGTIAIFAGTGKVGVSWGEAVCKRACRVSESFSGEVLWVDERCCLEWIWEEEFVPEVETCTTMLSFCEG